MDYSDETDKEAASITYMSVREQSRYNHTDAVQRSERVRTAGSYSEEDT